MFCVVINVVCFKEFFLCSGNKVVFKFELIFVGVDCKYIGCSF